MNDNRNSNQSGRSIENRSGGFFQDLTDRFRLISRLMVDSRVNIFLKLLPVGALAYALWPIDVPGPIDDVFIIWLGTTLFVQLCPPDVVDEHVRALNAGSTPATPWTDYSSSTHQENVVDGEYYESGTKNPNRSSR
jgi:hypothetical protein